MNMRYSRSCLVLLSCLFLAFGAFAQSAATATIVGHVQDPQGAVVANAKVTATNVATNVGRTVGTTSAGDYTIPNLTPGVYTVKVEATTFAPAEAKQFKLNVGEQRDLNFKLVPAGATTSLEVTAEAPLLETTKTEVSTSGPDGQKQELPTFAAITGGANDYSFLDRHRPGRNVDPAPLSTHET